MDQQCEIFRALFLYELEQIGRFSNLHIVPLRGIHCSISFYRKKDSQFDKKKEMEAMREEKEWLFVCYILDIYYSLNRPKFGSLFMQHCRYVQKNKDRSSRPEVFCKKIVLRNFAKFTGKHLCQSLFFNFEAGVNKLQVAGTFLVTEAATRGVL